MAAIVTTMPQSPGTTFRKVVQPEKLMPEKVWIASCNVMSFPTELLLHYRTFSFQLLFLFLLPGLLSGHLKTNSSPLLQI